MVNPPKHPNDSRRLPDDIREYLQYRFLGFSNSEETLLPIIHSISAYNNLESYGRSGYVAYLDLTRQSLQEIFLHQATWLGRIFVIKNGDRPDLFDNKMRDFTKSGFDIFKDLLKREMYSILHSDIGSSLTIPEYELVEEISSIYLKTLSYQSFLPTSWNKIKNVSLGIKSLLDELQNEIKENQPHLITKENSVTNITHLFEQRFSMVSGVEFYEAEKEIQWNSNASNDKKNIEWSYENLEELLNEIDFNFPNFSVAMVRICGITICIGSTLSFLASLMTINPILSDLSIKGVFTGAALAVSPSAASVIVKRIFPS